MLPFVLLLVFVIVSSEDAPKTLTKNGIPEINRIGRDSYLDAYTESHGGNLELNKVDTDREMNFPTGFHGGFPDEHFGVQYPYPDASSSSHQHYGPPHHHYEPPQQHHHEHHHHRPQRPFYGPPPPPPPPPPHYGPPTYGIPYGLMGIFDKLHLKLDLITIFKIILKLVLFKKLVSFIAIICLLLFIPWLKAKKHIHHHGGGGGGGGESAHDDPEYDEEDDDLMMRRAKGRSSRGDQRLNNVTVYILEAIENFTKQNSGSSSDDCDSIYCTVNKIAKNIGSRVSYKK